MDLSHYTSKINWGNSFFNNYGTKAVIPIKSEFPTLKTDQFSIKENDCLLFTSLELVEERKEVVTVKVAHYQQRLK